MAVRSVGAVLLAAILGIGGQLATAPAALAGEPAPTPSVDPIPVDADGSCDTRPATYPADGVPVPADAGCALLVGAGSAVVGEVWSWRDLDSFHWYSYPAATVGDGSAGSVLMCGSTDPARAGVVYDCSADSPYLMFTVSNVFVEWPAPPSDPLHYCQSVSFDGGSAPMTGTACASVQTMTSDAPVPTTTSTTEAGPTATTPPPAPKPGPSAEPTQPAVPPTPANTPVPTDATGGTPATPGQSTAPTASAPSPPDVPEATSIEAAPDPTGPVGAAATAPAADSTPLESVSVAVVGGARFPLGFVIALAVALAVGGIAMLSAPSLAAARRRRR